MFQDISITFFMKQIQPSVHYIVYSLIIVTYDILITKTCAHPEFSVLYINVWFFVLESDVYTC